jgi:hypothetical protein
MRAVETAGSVELRYPLSAALREELLSAGYTLSSEDHAAFTLVWWNK